MKPLRIGTRGSQLALWQARAVAASIAQLGGPATELVIIKTTGDRLSETRLSDVGGKRVFVKEIEDALASGDIDLAVHSAKDMPAILPDGLTIAAFLPREDPRDAVVLPAAAERMAVDDLPALVAALGQRPRIGTSSVRRVAQLLRLFPQAQFAPIRGNLDTRLRKIDAGDFDVIVLAVAGLRRLGFADRISLALPEDACVPAPGQGAVAVEIRESDSTLKHALAGVDDPATAAAVEAERSAVAALGGGCQVPIGALATVEGDALDLYGIVTSLDGTRAIRQRARGKLGDPAAAGKELARLLIAEGALDILEDVQRAQAPVEGIQP